MAPPTWTAKPRSGESRQSARRSLVCVGEESVTNMGVRAGDVCNDIRRAQRIANPAGEARESRCRGELDDRERTRFAIDEPVPGVDQLPERAGDPLRPTLGAERSGEHVEGALATVGERELDDLVVRAGTPPPDRDRGGRRGGRERPAELVRSDEDAHGDTVRSARGEHAPRGDGSPPA